MGRIRRVQTFVPGLGGAGGGPNLAALPSAFAGSEPNWTAFPKTAWALNTPFVDSTGVTLRRLSNASSPLSNTLVNFEYGTGGPRVSQRFGSNRYHVAYVLTSGSQQVRCFDVERGVGMVAGTDISLPISPGAIGYCFSMLPGEEHIIYFSDRGSPSNIRRYNVQTQAYEANAVFSGVNASIPAGGNDAGWMQTSWDGTRLVYQTNTGGIVVPHHVTLATGVRVTYPGSISGGINEIKMLKGTSRVVVLVTNGDTAAWWFVDENRATAIGAGTRSGHSDAGETNFYSFDPNVGTHPLAVQTPGTAPASEGGTWTGARTDRFAAGGTDMIGFTDGYEGMHWNQSGAGASEWVCWGANYPAEGISFAGWSVDSGSVYRSTITYNGPAYGQSARGPQVVQVVSGTTITGHLTRAASRGAMMAGTWFWDGSFLYAWMADNGSPTGRVRSHAGALLTEGIGYARADGGDRRKLCNNYMQGTFIPYEQRGFVNWAPDGRLVLFPSNLGVDGRVDLIMAEVPLA